MTALVYLLILAFVSVSASDNTCNGLEKVVMNTDLSRLLSDCARDESCSRVSCRAAGIIALGVDSVIITLKLCEIPGSPGVTIEFLKNGRALINQTVTAPTNVTKDLGISTVNAYVFVNSTANTLGLSIDPVIVTVNQLNASRSEQMITFTQIPISRSQCDSVTAATGPTTATIATTDVVDVTEGNSTSIAATGSTAPTATTDTVEVTESDSTPLAATGPTTATVTMDTAATTNATTVKVQSSVATTVTSTAADALKLTTTKNAASRISVLFGLEIMNFLLTLAVIKY